MQHQWTLWVLRGCKHMYNTHTSPATWLHLRNETLAMQILVFLCDGACRRDKTVHPLHFFGSSSDSFSFLRQKTVIEKDQSYCLCWVCWWKRLETQLPCTVVGVSVTHGWVHMGKILILKSVNTDIGGQYKSLKLWEMCLFFTWLEIGKSRLLFRCFSYLVYILILWCIPCGITVSNHISS